MRQQNVANGNVSTWLFGRWSCDCMFINSLYFLWVIQGPYCQRGFTLASSYLMWQDLWSIKKAKFNIFPFIILTPALPRLMLVSIIPVQYRAIHRTQIISQATLRIKDGSISSRYTSRPVHIVHEAIDVDCHGTAFNHRHSSEWGRGWLKWGSHRLFLQ